MKTYFTEPAIDVTKFHTEDCITTSAIEEEDDTLPLLFVAPCNG